MEAPSQPWIHPDFDRNHRAFPVEELWKYAGKHIAWSWDGTRIVAAGDTLEEVGAALAKLGLDSGKVVHDYVDSLDLDSYF